MCSEHFVKVESFTVRHGTRNVGDIKNQYRAEYFQQAQDGDELNRPRKDVFHLANQRHYRRRRCHVGHARKSSH